MGGGRSPWGGEPLTKPKEAAGRKKNVRERFLSNGKNQKVCKRMLTWNRDNKKR